MHTMCRRLCETCDLGSANPPKSLLHLTYSQGAACLLQRVKRQRAWIGAAGPLLRPPVFGQVVHDTTRDPPNPKTTGRLGGPGGPPKVRSLIQTYGKSAGMVWGQWDHLCDIRFLLARVTLGQVTVVHVTPQTPNRRVDRAVLGACQRCIPLTQKYGKSAGMVWGRRDHLCSIRFLSLHMKLAPNANSCARFCSELVGARRDSLHSSIRYHWFRARSRNLPSLGLFGDMVLVGQARQNESNRGIFCDFHFCGAMARAHCRL
jgi:hypothetical protein